MSEAVLANRYREALARQAFNGTSVAPAASMAFGIGGLDGTGKPKTVDPDQTGLNNELIRKSLSQKIQEDLFSVTCTGRIEKSELNGYTISEAVVLDENGEPIGFKNFGGKYKESDEYYEISIKIKH